MTTKLRKLIYLIVPPILYVAFVYVVLNVFGYCLAGLLIAYYLPPAGKESVIPLMISYLRGHGNLAVIIAILLITATDAFTAFYIIWNFDIVLMIPKIGKIVLKLEEKAKKFIEEYDLARNTYLGLFVFVFIPFQGTGSTTASIIGRLLGLDNLKLFLTIVSASFTSSLIIAIISDYIATHFRTQTILIVVGLIFIVGITARSIKKYRVHRRVLHEAQRRVREGVEGVGNRLHINRDKKDNRK
ncbi:small multi-drug export protein [Archaeoglobus sp.]